MDLNFLYSQQQISLIRAHETASADRRVFHEAVAEGFARRIGNFRAEFTARDASGPCGGAGR